MKLGPNTNPLSVPGEGEATSRRDKRRRDKRNAILKGAFGLFLRNGFHGTSMDRITQETGVSKPTIYSYFDSKEGLFAAIIKRAANSVLKVTHSSPPKDQPVDEALYHFAVNYADTVLKPEMLAFHRLVLGEAQRFPELGSLYYDSGYLISERGLEEYLRHFVDRGELFIRNFEDASNDFWGLVLSYLHTYLLCNPSKALPKKKVNRYLKRGIKNFVALYGSP